LTKAPATQARDYAALNIAWAGAVVGLLRVSDGAAPSGSELPVLGLASFAAAKGEALEAKRNKKMPKGDRTKKTRRPTREKQNSPKAKKAEKKKEKE